MPERYDFIQIRADVTPQGWIKDEPIITRAGVFVYTDKNGKKSREYRPESEVFNSEALESLVGIPITDGHRGMVSAERSDGILGTVISPGVRDGNNVKAKIVIHDPKRMGARRELSLGYDCILDDTPGTAPTGELYDAIQTKFTFNHLAVVEKGRAGNARLRLDSADDAASGAFTLESEMPTETKLVTVKLDELEYQASPEVAKAFDKFKGKYSALKTKFDAAEAEIDTLKEDVKKHLAEVDNIKKNAVAGVRARILLETIAKDHGITFKDDDSNRSLKEKIITKLRNLDVKFEEKSDDYVDSAFDIAVSAEEQKTKKAGETREKLDGAPRNDSVDTDRGGNAGGARAARNRMLADISIRPVMGEAAK